MARITSDGYLKRLKDVFFSSPADGDVVTYVAADSEWENKPASGGGGGDALLTPYIGDGSDGAVTVSGTVTLTRDMYYTTLHVPSGATLVAMGCAIRASTSVTVDSGGVIQANGASASGATVGTLGTQPGTAPQGVLGKAPGTTTGQSTVGGNTRVVGAAGGAGGNVGATAGGIATAYADAKGGIQFWASAREVLTMAHASILFGSNTGSFQAGNGGASGASVDGTHQGGAGGNGGGSVVINTPILTNNGTISANGGAGATAPSSSNGGGGGGGGGGFILTNTSSAVSGGGAYAVSGGVLGAGVGTGANGTAGASGSVIHNVWA